MKVTMRITPMMPPISTPITSLMMKEMIFIHKSLFEFIKANLIHIIKIITPNEMFPKRLPAGPSKITAAPMNKPLTQNKTPIKMS